MSAGAAPHADRSWSGPTTSVTQAWVVGGRITYDAADRRRATSQTVRGWVLPGLVDAHCHVGLDAHGAVDDATAEAAGARRPRRRHAAHPRRRLARRHPVGATTRDDLPRIVRAGRHIARTRRYIRNFAHEVEPEQLVEQVRLEARAGDGWVKLVGDWIDRDTGDLSPCWPARRARRGGRGGPRGGRPGDGALLRRGVAARLRRRRHRLHRARHAGSSPTPSTPFAAQGIAIVPTLVNIDTFPQIAEPAREKFPDYHRAHARPARPPLRDGRGGARRRRSRSTSARTPVARCRTGWSPPRWPSWRRPGSRPTEALDAATLGGARVAGPARAGGGRGGRPGRLRRRPARGHRRAGRPAHVVLRGRTLA